MHPTNEGADVGIGVFVCVRADGHAAFLGFRREHEVDERGAGKHSSRTRTRDRALGRGQERELARAHPTRRAVASAHRSSTRRQRAHRRRSRRVSRASRRQRGRQSPAWQRLQVRSGANGARGGDGAACAGDKQYRREEGVARGTWRRPWGSPRADAELKSPPRLRTSAAVLRLAHSRARAEAPRQPNVAADGRSRAIVTRPRTVAPA